MARTARIAVPNLPHHLCQRGHNGRDVFYSAGDFSSYLETLAQFRTELDVKIFGYCLMTNHVHLIVDPGADVANLGRLMKRLAGRHTRRLNFIQQRTGTAWGGRFKCSPIQTERYLLTCLRYVDLNPVRARLVARAGDYGWSSYRAHAGHSICDWLDVDPVSCECADDGARQQAYRDFVAAGESELELRFIRESLQRGHVTSSEDFARSLAKQHGFTLPEWQPGRKHAKKKRALRRPLS